MSTSIDAASLSQLLGGFLSTNPEVRKQAEVTFNNIKQHKPALLCSLLLDVAAQDLEWERRQQAAITLRTLFRDMVMGREDHIWPHLDEESQESIKSRLLTMSTSEPNELVRQSLGDVIAGLGSVLLAHKQWPELPHAVETMMSCPTVDIQILGLRLCANLEGSMSEQLCQHSQQVVELLQHKLQSQKPALRLAVIELVANIVRNEVKKDWKAYMVLFPQMIESLVLFVSQVDMELEKSTVDLLQHLIEIAESSSGDYFRDHFDFLFTTTLNVCANTQLVDDIRQMAMELLLTIVCKKPKWFRTDLKYLDSIIQQLMQFMLCVEDDEEWQQRELTAEADEEAQNYDVGEYGLDRVANAVGGEVAIPVMFQHVAQYLAHTEWRYKVVGLVTISQTIEYLPEDRVESQLGEIVDLLLKEAVNEHHRVRFVACRALGQVALDHQPYVQQVYHAKVLPVLINLLFSDQCAKVQSQAFAAFVNFAEEVQLEHLKPYVPEVMAQTIRHLRELTPTSASQKRNVCEQCITSIAVVAGVLSDEFLPYCSTVVPLMQEISRQSQGKQFRQLQGRAFECLSIIAYAVELKGMEAVMQSVIADLVTLFNMNLEPEDPRKDYVYEALTRLIRALKQGFTPFLPQVLPQLLESVKLEADTSDLFKSEGEDRTLVFLASGTLATVRTSKVEDLEKNLRVLTTIVESAKQDFLPHAEVTMAQILPLLEIQSTDEIEVQALTCVAQIIGVTRNAGNLQRVKEWTLATMQIVIRTADDDLENGVTRAAAYVTGVCTCLEYAGNDIFNSMELTEICSKVFQLVEGSTERRARISSATTKDADEEDIECCTKELQEEQVFRETTLRILEVLSKTHHTTFVESCGKLILDFVLAYIDPVRSADDRALPIFVICDLLDNLGSTGAALVRDFLPQIILYITDEDRTVRQVACYAVSLLAPIQEIDSPLFVEALTRLSLVLRDASARQKDNCAATENACSALIALAVYRSHIFGDQLRDAIDLSIQFFPFEWDLEEGVKVAKLLVSQLQQDTSLFWGRNRMHVAKIVRQLSAAYSIPSAEANLNTLIREIMRKIEPTTTLGLMNEPSLSHAEKQGIQKLLRECS